jgi:hypothetical protein
MVAQKGIFLSTEVNPNLSHNYFYSNPDPAFCQTF